MVRTTRLHLDRIASSTRNARLAHDVIVGDEIVARERPVAAMVEIREPLRLEGWVNVALVGAIVLVVLMQGVWQPGEVAVLGQHVGVERLVAVALFVAITAASVWLTPAALREAHRVLKRGGRFYVLEFSTSEWPGFGGLYDRYSEHLIPKIGKAVAKDEESYRYLVESIRRFPRMEPFRKMIEEAGFKSTSVEPILGGLVAIHGGWKI